VRDFLIFACVGFIAQLVDGALGMAYGVACSSVLLGLGIPPATASASVHAAEVFTTGASGIAHWRFGNLSKPLLWKLAVPGMIGGAIGAYFLVWAPPTIVKPAVNIYLALAGLWILIRAFHVRDGVNHIPKATPLLGLAGGFLDAVGGGGWGPLVTSTLIGSGTQPRIAIGSVNAAEFFVTVVISATFLVTSGLSLWPIMAGLLVGGVLAAPIAARITKRLPEKPLMIMVGVVIVALAIRGLVLSVWS
jgi:uncharacterized membrane protein YfcA